MKPKCAHLWDWSNRILISCPALVRFAFQVPLLHAEAILWSDPKSCCLRQFVRSTTVSEHVNRPLIFPEWRFLSINAATGRVLFWLFSTVDSTQPLAGLYREIWISMPIRKLPVVAF